MFQTTNQLVLGWCCFFVAAGFLATNLGFRRIAAPVNLTVSLRTMNESFQNHCWCRSWRYHIDIYKVYTSYHPNKWEYPSGHPLHGYGKSMNIAILWGINGPWFPYLSPRIPKKVVVGAWSMKFPNWMLVGGWPTPLKNISQLGWWFPICGKIKNVPNHQSGMEK